MYHADKVNVTFALSGKIIGKVICDVYGDQVSVHRKRAGDGRITWYKHLAKRQPSTNATHRDNVTNTELGHWHLSSQTDSCSLYSRMTPFYINK